MTIEVLKKKSHPTISTKKNKVLLWRTKGIGSSAKEMRVGTIFVEWTH